MKNTDFSLFSYVTGLIHYTCLFMCFLVNSFFFFFFLKKIREPYTFCAMMCLQQKEHRWNKSHTGWISCNQHYAVQMFPMHLGRCCLLEQRATNAPIPLANFHSSFPPGKSCGQMFPSTTTTLPFLRSHGKVWTS